MGLYYDQGYFRQRLTHDGRQYEEYIDVDSRLLPLRPAQTPDGRPVLVSIDTRTGTLNARVWRVAVGRNTLLLLDSDVEGNQPGDRDLTSRLYGGDERTRIRQELMLGVGGVRALAAMGLSPGVAHLNEGHSAFATLEFVRQRMETEGIDADEALRRTAAQIVFTTHTPVPAGHDRFSADLVEEHLGPLRESLGWSLDQLMALGRVNPSDGGERFCMTVLALKGSRRANAVSSLHGRVSRAMWTSLYPGVRRGPSADRSHHQRRSRAVMARSADASALRPALRAGLAATLRGSRLLGRHRRRGRWRAVGDAPDAQGAAHHVCAQTGG